MTAERMTAEVELLQARLAAAYLHWSEVTWMEGFREGVHRAFDTLSERRDERVMVLIHEAQQEGSAVCDFQARRETWVP